MKGWTKGLLIVSAVFVAAGTAVCVGGWAMGGRFGQLGHRSYGIVEPDPVRPEGTGAGPGQSGQRPGESAPGTENWSGPGADSRSAPGAGEDGAGSFCQAAGEGQSTPPGQEAGRGFDGRLTFEGRTVTDLQTVVMGGKAEIRYDDTEDSIRIICDSDNFRCRQEMDDDTLEIEIRPKRSGWSLTDYEDWEETAVVILIPAGASLEEAELEVKGGALSVGQIRADKLELELEAGVLEVQGGCVRELKGECRAGALTYRGEVLWDMEAECMAGGISYEVEGKKEDFNYKIEILGGSILIDGTEQGKLKKETVLEYPGAAKTAELECMAGAIEIGFYENKEGE